MKFPSGNRRITLVVSPVDLRSGYLSLSAIARAALDIDVESGKEIVVFISRRRTSCKVIWCDERGSATLVRGFMPDASKRSLPVLRGRPRSALRRRIWRSSLTASRSTSNVPEYSPES